MKRPDYPFAPSYAPDRIGEAIKVTHVVAAPSVLWHAARNLCDLALTSGKAFVLLMDNAQTPTDPRFLSQDDQAHAARFRKSADRTNFILGRMMVHHLVRPRQASLPCVLTLAPHGKPYILGSPAFNLSHSGNWIACIVASDGPLGIDIEVFAAGLDLNELMDATTHPAERLYIQQVPPAGQLNRFKQCWTRKEAVLKATGVGLSEQLTSINVRLHEPQPILTEPLPLRLLDLQVLDNVAISLAAPPQVPGIILCTVQ